MLNTNITETELLAKFQVGEALLPPLVIESIQFPAPRRTMDWIMDIDAMIEARIPGEAVLHKFVVEAKSRSTPEAFVSALGKAEARAKVFNGHPLIVIPYLAPAKIQELEKRQTSGVDLCGNGVIVVPGQTYIVRTGQPNAYKDSRPLSNPFQGKSSLVARVLLEQDVWKSLLEIAAAIEQRGATLSQAQISKAVHALEEERMIQRQSKTIVHVDRAGVLQNLAKGWRAPVQRRVNLRVDNKQWQEKLANNRDWAVTGESSVTRYASFSQSGPLQLAVRHADRIQALVKGKPEPIPNFADLQLVETLSEGSYFDNKIDQHGLRWASPLQTWLELQAGDVRQQAAAKDIYKNFLMRINNDRPDPKQAG